MEGLEDAYNFKYHKGMHYKLTTNVQPVICLKKIRDGTKRQLEEKEIENETQKMRGD
jgi:hypothetical protein